MKVLVAGGTGRLGTLVLRDLAAREVTVRVLTRDPARAAHLAGLAEVIVGDVRRPDSLAEAVASADVVVSAVHGFAGPGRVSPASVDRDGNANLVSAAAKAGADVVLLSVMGASPDSSMELFRCKWEAEETLRATAPNWTIVRASAFVELWADLMTKTARPVVFGRGDNPVNFVSVTDVAASVCRAVLDRGTRGRVLEVAGPENLTFNQLAALVQELQGTSGPVRHIPRTALRVLARVHRQPRAALSMDTEDMTADFRGLPDGSVPTPLREALRRSAQESARL